MNVKGATQKLLNTSLNTFCLVRQGMAPVLEMAMVAKLLMILIDSPMMWDVPKKDPENCTTGRRPYIARKLKN